MKNNDGKNENDMKQDGNDIKTVDQETVEQHDFDLLSQYVDGELSQQEALQVKQRLLSEPELNKQLRELQALQANVRSVIPVFENEPMSEKLSSLLAHDSDESKKNESNEKGQYLAANSGWKFNFSLAASIMLVAVMGIFVFNSSDQSQTGLRFQDSLFSSLQSNQSWSSDDGLELMIVQSYLDESDTLCREYFARDSEHSEHGISCFDNGSWNKQAFELKFNQSPDHYVTASASEDGGVEAFLKSKSLKTLSSEEELKVLKSN